MVIITGDVDESVLEEGCFYLSELGLTPEKIASHFEIRPEDARRLAVAYSSKLKSGKVTADPFDRTFWADVMREAEGDVKVTFVSEKGLHHEWKSELAKLDGPSLMSIFEASKDYLNADANQKFLDYPPPKGYDPLALDREIRKALSVLGELMDAKWKRSFASDGENRNANQG